MARADHLTQEWETQPHPRTADQQAGSGAQAAREGGDKSQGIMCPDHKFPSHSSPANLIQCSCEQEACRASGYSCSMVWNSSQNDAGGGPQQSWGCSFCPSRWGAAGQHSSPGTLMPSLAALKQLLPLMTSTRLLAKLHFPPHTPGSGFLLPRSPHLSAWVVCRAEMLALFYRGQQTMLSKKLESRWAGLAHKSPLPGHSALCVTPY